MSLKPSRSEELTSHWEGWNDSVKAYAVVGTASLASRMLEQACHEHKRRGCHEAAMRFGRCSRDRGGLQGSFSLAAQDVRDHRATARR